MMIDLIISSNLGLGQNEQIERYQKIMHFILHYWNFLFFNIENESNPEIANIPIISNMSKEMIFIIFIIVK
jgi:hypothetical protein